MWELFPVNARGEDLVVWQDESRQQVRAVLHMLRQQHARDADNLSLVDFVLPEDQGVDWAGAFVVQAGDGLEEWVAVHEACDDDYKSILAKAVADRLAEAAAEWLHREVRCEHWGYAEGEALSVSELMKERYRGIRPAPGYPAQPDHTEKRTIFELLGASEAIGVTLTEAGAMWPPPSVCGLYFGHADARYFAVGPLGRNQVADYAKRKSWAIEEARRWLSSNVDESIMS